MLLLRCPKCGNEMKYQNSDSYLADKKKRCVYCGKSFKVSSNILKKIS